MGWKTLQEDRRIRIIQLDNTRWFNAGAGYAVSLSRGLKAMGHDVLFMGKKGLPPVEAAREAGLETNAELSFETARFFADSRRLAGIIAGFKPHVVNAHRAEAMNLALMARRLSGDAKPAVIRARTDIRPLLNTPFNRWIYKKVDGAIAPWEAGRLQHITVGMAAQRTLLLPGGVDTGRFHPSIDGASAREELGIPPDAPVAGIAGRLDHVKGQRDFLRAAACALERVPEAYFVVMGKEVNITVDELRRFAREVNVSGRTRFMGWRDDIERFMAALDVGVVASVGSEALSRTALEYMACGLPVVATRVGGLPDIVVSGKTGVLTPPMKPRGIGIALTWLFNNTDVRKRMGREARNRAEKGFSIERIARRAVEFYEKLLCLRKAKL